MPVRSTIFQKSRNLWVSIPCHSSFQLQASPTNLYRSLHSSISCAAVFSRQVSQWVSSFLLQLLLETARYLLLQAMWHLLTHQTSWQTGAPSLHPFKPCDCFLLFQRALILNAQPESSYVTSYPAPAMMCYFHQFPPIFYFLLAAIFSQGISVTQGHPVPASCPGAV